MLATQREFATENYDLLLETAESEGQYVEDTLTLLIRLEDAQGLEEFEF